jgi:hypothetical protein
MWKWKSNIGEFLWVRAYNSCRIVLKYVVCSASYTKRKQRARVRLVEVGCRLKVEVVMNVQYFWLQYLIKVTLPGGDRSCMPPDVFSIPNLPTCNRVQHPSWFCTGSLILYVWCWILSTKNYHYGAPMLLDSGINKIPVKFMGRDSSVGIATRYGLGI